MRTDRAHAPDSLTSRLGVFHRDYRGLMLALLANGAALAALTFVSLQLITAIVQAFLTSGGESVLIDESDPTKSSARVTIKAASVNTGVAALDDHLRTADFFEVEKYPEITFKSTAVKQSSAEHALVSGDLTIHGVTKPVTLDVQLIHRGKHPLGQFIDYYKGQWLGFRATATILRSDFDVGRFAPLTSDRIEISISTEMKAK